MITMIVKGDEAAVFEAAHARGVELTSITPHSRFDECIVSTYDQFLDLVVDWYCEPGEAPFPHGAMTYYHTN